MASFRSEKVLIESGLSQQLSEDLNKKVTMLLIYDFECCMYLQKWDELLDIVEVSPNLAVQIKHC